MIHKPNILDISESMVLNIGEKTVGDKIKLVLSYDVIEVTKNYVVLKINFAYIEDSKRII